MAPDKILSTCAAVKDKAWELTEAFSADGYRFDLWSDGYADVHSPNGGTYTVENFRCSCPDATDSRREGGSYQLPDGRHICKHALALIIARPCRCGKTQILHEVGGYSYFRCRFCGDSRDARIVKQERQAAQERLGRTQTA